MDHVSLDATRLKPARQPEAVAAGFEGKRNPRDGTPGPDRLIPPPMQQGKQPFWARLELLARLTLNPGMLREDMAVAAATHLSHSVELQPVGHFGISCSVRQLPTSARSTQWP
jgi:hypothetical protein